MAVKTSTSAFLSTAQVNLFEALVTCCLALVLSCFLSSTVLMFESYVHHKYQCNEANCRAGNLEQRNPHSQITDNLRLIQINIQNKIS